MTYGRIFNGIKYIGLLDDNDFKKNSLHDNIYFTLRDIFANAESLDTVIEANVFNNTLTGGVCFEDRTENFQYTTDKFYTEQLLHWLNNFNIHYFEFLKPEDDEIIVMSEYIKWDDWWFQFQELKRLVKEHTKNAACGRE